MGITVLATAIKVCNSGGGYQQKTVREEVQDPVNLIGKKKTVRKQYQSRERVSGTDYVVFQCPRCDKRNKRSVYDAKESSEAGRLVFKCNGCYNDIAVQRPISLSIGNESNVGLSGIGHEVLGPDGRPARGM